MGRKRTNNAKRIINKTNLCSRVSFFFFCILSSMIFSSTTTIACLDASKCPMFSKGDIDHHHQKYDGRRIEHGMVFEGKTKVPLDWARRFLGRPGSSPPQCTSKCGKCTPCRPVHVTVPPGTPVTAEYYPEAWRCKCGNKLSMP